jgi:hypothetical protein
MPTYQLNTEADIAAFVNTVWADAMLLARENSVVPNLCRVFGDMSGAAVRKNAKYGGATVNQVNELDDLASQAFTPSTDQTLTPYEYGAQYFVTDLRVESDPFGDIVSDASTDLGLALGVKIDTAMAGKFSSFTGGTVGGTTTDLTWAQWFGAMERMRFALAPRPWICVLSPAQWTSLGTAIAPGVTMTNSPGLQDEFMRNYFIANVSGVDVYLDANIGTAASGVHGGMFSPAALALDWRRAPRVRPQRDESRRGLELNLSAVFAYGVWRPQYGVDINTAGSLL